jgi:acetyltransferase-like isoleucine patch superfamily enzyme
MNLFRYIKLLKVRLVIKRHNPNSIILIQSEKISCPNKISISSGSRIGPGSMINAAGGLTVGFNVIFGPNVVIWTQNHNFFNANLLPYDEKIIDRPVFIGNNCWFGEGVKISPGSVIGEGVIASIGSVIFGEIPDYAIVRGNPAIVIAFRKDLEKYKLLNIKTDSYLLNKIND